jgi:hypothetical protein
MNKLTKVNVRPVENHMEKKNNTNDLSTKLDGVGLQVLQPDR